MYREMRHKRWLKVCLSMLFTLILFLTVNQPTSVASEKLNKLSDYTLYRVAFDAIQDDNPIWAVMYLWAYVQRDPPMYTYNTDGHKDNVDAQIKSLVNYIYGPKRRESLVNADLDNCGCYPCNKCQLRKSNSQYEVGTTSHHLSQPPLSGVLQAPPDAVAVCTEIGYAGSCQFLSAGDYDNANQIGLPNDSISSVMVGSRMKLTLYVHGSLTGPFITFTTDDSDLRDNSIDRIYKWDNNATSLRVEKR